MWYRARPDEVKDYIDVKSFKLLGAYLILGFLTLSPLLWASVPPLGDYPNHLANMAILAHIGPSELHANYVVNWRPIPNLAMDMVVPLLARLLPLEVSGRLFIAATMILLVAGTAMLHRLLHGRFGFWPLCSLIFIYNFTFWYGFLNFLFTLGVVFFAFALWIATCNWRLLPRLIAFSALASLIFLMHLFAFGIYALLIASYELGIALRQSDRASFVITHIAVRLGQ